MVVGPIAIPKALATIIADIKVRSTGVLQSLDQLATCIANNDRASSC